MKSRAPARAARKGDSARTAAMTAAKREAELAGGPSSVIRPFARSLPMLLLRAREALMLRFRPHLQAHGLTEQQWRILRVLAEAEALEIGEIGVRCNILPASLSLMLPKLELAGIVDRRANPADQRRVIVSLTAKGRRLFAEMGRESERIYAEITRDVGPERLRELYRLLDEVVDDLARSPRRDP